MPRGSTPDGPGFSLPVGTVTFLLTDVAASTRGWEAAPAAMAGAIARHYELLDEAIVGHGGVRPVEQGEGDSVVAAFARASDAVAAALDAQRTLQSEPWPEGATIAVRMAVHTGEAELRDEGNYFGPAVIRCARLRAIAAGAQVLVSGPTVEVVGDRLPAGVTLADLGRHRLKDLGRPERVFELRHADLATGFGPLRSLDNLPNNLPTQLTAFVGRTTELAALRATVATSRLLTLNGAGGCGKTRLAEQLAADVLDRYPGGAWLVELANVVDPERVVAAAATALGERDLAGDLVEVIVNRLGDLDTLVILDNCEHLLAPVAMLVDTLLRRCPRLTILATSREPLGVPGEVAWRVPSLSAPSTTEPTAVEVLSQYDAVRLFIERASRARPNFRLTAENGPSVAQICHRLDGIPLAIELAAARVRGMTVEQVAAGLDDRFRLLTGGARTVLPRQQTLQASVDWGYELLTEAERAVFRRLAVFAGGFTLDAAESVVVGDGIETVDVLGVLLALVDKSMVAADDDGARYHLLETLRQYGAARLVEAGEMVVLRNHHLDWSLTLFDSVAIRATGDLTHLARVAVEIDNLRAAYEWAVAEGDADAARGHAAVLTGWECDRGDASEAVRIAARAVELEGGQARLLAVALSALLFARYENGDVAPVVTDVTALLEALDALDPDDVIVRAGCLRMLSFSPWHGTGTRRRLEESLRLAEGADLPAVAEICASQLAVLLGYQGRLAESEAYADRVHADPLTTVAGQNALLSRALAAQRAGRFDDARAWLDQLGRVFAVRRHPRLLAFDEAMRVLLDLAQGCDSGAATRVEALLDDARRRGFRAGVVSAGWAPGIWTLAHGDIDTAVDQLLAWRADVSGALALGRSWNGFLTDALLAAGRVADARTDIEATRSQSPIAPSENSSAFARLIAADALIYRAEGDLAAAERLFHDALEIDHTLGWRPDVVHVLEALAEIAAVNESCRECARLAGAAQRLREELGYVLRWPYAQRLLDDALAAARAALGDTAFDVAVGEGRALGDNDAVAYAQRARGERKRPSSGWASLTPVEAEVARLVAEGLTNKQIGEALFIGGETVKTHLSHVYDKIGVRSRAALAAQLTARQR